MVPTVVFGDDGSVGADVAWLWINNHAWPGWRLEILHAVVPEVVRVGGPQPQPRAWKHAQPRTAFSGTAFIDVADLIIEQDPRLALTRHADLLVIGARGDGFVKAMHLGSTAEWLMSQPPAPLVIARHGRQTRSVMMCVDGSPASNAALAALCAMPWIAGATVHVAAAYDGRVNADEVVAAAAAALRAASARVVCEVLFGDATHELLAYSEQFDLDLVALGTRGLSGLKRWVVGSTAARIARSVETSVMLVGDPMR
jgi:nucleotide-binding universal stress UspA family protein